MQSERARDGHLSGFRPPQPGRTIGGMRIAVPEHEVEFSAVRAQGPGGQNVHKVSSAVHLRFDIRASSLPAHVKHRLLALGDQRVSRQGVIVIKAQSHRRQEQNRADALARLAQMVDQACATPAVRKATRPTWGARQRRLEAKSQRSRLKATRGRERL